MTAGTLNTFKHAAVCEHEIVESINTTVMTRLKKVDLSYFCKNAEFVFITS